MAVTGEEDYNPRPKKREEKEEGGRGMVVGE